MNNYLEILEPERYYHIYNHAVGRDCLFRTEENYIYFLKRYSEYIHPIVDTYAYCLMPNHFHIALRIKSALELSGLAGFSDLTGFQNLSGLTGLISKQFSNFFNAYSKSFNKQQNRIGNLFERPFKRKLIDDDSYFKQIIHYIHFNPVHHGFVDDLREWKHSSFESFFSDKSSKLKREEVISWFGDRDNFYYCHQKQIDERLALELE